MYCWGSNKYGQLGLGGTEEDVFRQPFDNKYINGDIKQVSCGHTHTLILLCDGTVLSCGNNDYEQLGHDGSHTRPERIQSLEIHKIVQIACGHSFSLALNNYGDLFCWGSIDGTRDSTALFFNRPTCIKKPLLSDSRVVQIACGNYHFLALTEDGKIFVMGLNDYGQLGLGFSKDTCKQPTHLKSLQGIPVLQIAAGGYHSFVLSMSGQIFSFGKNTSGQLGFGDNTNRVYPMNLKFLSTQKVCFIACGEEFTAVLTRDGGVFTFGAGMYGQLGHNTLTNECLPRKVFDLMGSEVTQIACGRCHTLAYIKSTNRLYSFGLSVNGQLGIDTTNDNKQAPNQVPSVNRLLHESNIYLYGIYAGGDQSFLVYSKQPQTNMQQQQEHLKQLDYRGDILSDKQIMTINSSNLIALQMDRTIRTVFNSASCLNASFLMQNDHYGTSSKYPGIDIEKIKLMAKYLIANCDLAQLEIILQKLIDLFNSLPENPPSIEALRLYVAIPYIAYTLFEDNNQMMAKFKNNIKIVHCLLLSYAQAINRLNEKSASRVIDYWFAWTGFEFFKNLIEIYKQIVIYIINAEPITNENEILFRHTLLKSSMNLLLKLHKINLEFREIVPYDTFYINNLSEKIDIKKDYYEWLRRKHLKTDSVLFCDYPFVFDALAKTLLLQTDADFQMQIALQEAWQQNLTSIFTGMQSIDTINPFLILMVRRDQIVHDTLNQLSKQRRDDLKKPMKVIFINEDAYDAGGVKKEFFMLLIREILDPKYGMFIYYDESRQIWFNDQSFEEHDMYHLIGVLCGLAIYNSIIIDLPFPLALYKKLLKEPVNLNDLKSLSPTIGKSLEQVLEYDGDDFEDVFDLTFEITRQRFDETINVDLTQNGSQIQVTKDNRKQYVNAYVDYIFNKSCDLAFDAFSKGFHHVCGSRVLELFHSNELMSMVIGNQNYDFFELEKNTEYKGVYWKDHPTIRYFWSVFHEFDLQTKKKFLLFLTGSDRIPILGIKYVKICVQPTNGGDQYFPVAHTCFNLLDLPQYTSKEILKEKLLHAIEHNQGFTLV